MPYVSKFEMDKICDRLDDLRRLQKRATLNEMALTWVAAGEKPDFSETVSWTEHEEEVTVEIRGYRLGRADSGIAVLVWKYWDERTPMVEAAYVSRLTSAEQRKGAVRMDRFKLADALGRLGAASVYFTLSRNK